MPKPKAGVSLDLATLIPVILLLIVGNIVLYSLQRSLGGEALFSTAIHLVATTLGLVVYFIAARFKASDWARITPYVFVVSSLLLVAVLVFGRDIQGSRRWLDIGQLQFQASELAKISLILIQARFLSSKSREINNIKTLVVSLAYLALPAVLILLEPDLGTSALLVVAWLVMLMATNIKRSSVILLLSVLLLLVPIAYLNLEGYQQERIDTFLSYSSDGGEVNNYNVTQALISIGSGGWLGTGIDSGTQSSLAFIPSSHTDFVFSVTAEKLGFVGATILLALLCLVVLRVIYLAWNAKTPYVRYLGLGIATMFGAQMIINVGMNLGLVPVTGLPLPFVSYGGTHIVISLLALGIFSGAYRHENGG